VSNSLKGYKPDSARWPVLRNGVIFFKGTNVACFILNRSRGGAGLVLQNDVALPLVFDLEIDGENMRRRCVAIWRDQCRIGVSFDMERVTQAAQDEEPVEVQPTLVPLLPAKEQEQDVAHLLSDLRLVALTGPTKTTAMAGTEATASVPAQPEIPHPYKDSGG
jgi:hypothetical protein